MKEFPERLKQAIEMHQDFMVLKNCGVLTKEDTDNLDEHLRAELLRFSMGLSTKSGTIIPDTKFKVPRK